MPIAFSPKALIANPGQTYSLAQLITVTAGGLPEYLVLTGLDRNEYAAASTGAVGSLTGNQNTATFIQNASNGDAANIGIVFQYSEKGYINTTYGALTDIKLTASTDADRSEYLSLYAYGSAGTTNDAQQTNLTLLADSAVNNPSLQFFMAPPSGGIALGALDVVTRSGVVDASPNVATPKEIAAVALSYVGKTWNINGCWVLVSDIAASAGASLPVNSAMPEVWQIQDPTANGL